MEPASPKVHNMENSLNISEVIPYVTRHMVLGRKSACNGENLSILWLSGPSGIGKSEMIRQFCRKKGYGLKVVYMATMMLEQITGLPLVREGGNGKSIRWSRPEILNLETLEFPPAENDSPIVLFLDDAHLINRQIQAYLFQLLTYRTIHDHRLPKQAVILLAGNRSVDRAGFQEILAPVANRIFFVELRADVDQWVEDFAAPMSIRRDITTFLKRYPEYFLGTPRESEAWPSPRSWTYASLTLDASGKNLDENTLFTVLRGHVGTEAATRFLEYHKLFVKWDPRQILLAKQMLEIDQLNKIEAYALLSACVTYILTHLRETNFQTNPELEQELGGLIVLVSEMSKFHREIVPLGLKTLLLSEKQTTGETRLIRRLVEEADVVAELLKVA